MRPSARWIAILAPIIGALVVFATVVAPRPKPRELPDTQDQTDQYGPVVAAAAAPGDVKASERFRQVLAIATADDNSCVDCAVSLPVEPTPGGLRRKVYHNYQTGQHYLLTTTETWDSELIINRGIARLTYRDRTPLYLSARGTVNGPVPDAAALDRWLATAFHVHGSAAIEAHVIYAIHRMTAGASLTNRTATKGGFRDRFTTVGGGQVEITIDRGTRASIAQTFGEQAIEILTVERSVPSPDWLDGQMAKTADESVPLIDGEFTFDAVRNRLMKGWDEVRTISTAEARRLAEQFGYLWPSQPVVVQRAQVYMGQLTLDIYRRGNVYSVTQLPPGNSSVEQVNQFTLRSRQLPRFRVAEVKDPGTQAVWIYYIHGERFLLVETTDFNDATLDDLVMGMW